MSRFTLNPEGLASGAGVRLAPGGISSSPPEGVGADVKIAVVNATWTGSTSTIDVTDSSVFGGETPKAAIVITTWANAGLNANRLTQFYSIGYTDGTRQAMHSIVSVFIGTT